VARIAATIDAPVTVDFEGGYSEDHGELADNISRLLDLGVVGINFEDRVVKRAGLYDIDRQARRISAIRKAAKHKGVDLFINARTDIFFEHGDLALSSASPTTCAASLGLCDGPAARRDYLCAGSENRLGAAGIPRIVKQQRLAFHVRLSKALGLFLLVHCILLS
jgi:hypothetical protein